MSSYPVLLHTVLDARDRRVLRLADDKLKRADLFQADEVLNILDIE